MIKRAFFLLLTILVIASCSNELDLASQLRMRAGESEVFHATIEDNSSPDTKVYADDQMRVLWNAGDQISIFNLNTYNQPYRFKGKDGANSGDFEKVSTGAEFSMSGDIDHIYSVYPYDETTEVSYNGVLTLSLPVLQHYRPNSFGIGANTMVSATDNNMLRFKNVGGYLSFKLYGESVSVKRITLKGNNHEKLAGLATVTMPVGGTPAIVMQNTANEEITLECDTPVNLNASAENYTEFWFVIPPTTFSQGFTVTVTDALGGIFEKSTQNEVEISRNALSRMSSIQVVPDYDHVFVPFEDANFKAYCVEYFDKDGDGEISYNEAQSITIIKVKTDDIKSLKGIEYFKNLSVLDCQGTYDYEWDSSLNGYVAVGHGLLTTLDLRKNTALTKLYCSANHLTSLDLSQNTALTTLYCQTNLLANLDLSHNIALTTLYCKTNQLTHLDLSGCPLLTEMIATYNQLSSLDVSHNSALTYLDCDSNQLTGLDVSHNTVLSKLYCSSNQLTSLDVSHNPTLSLIHCSFNLLTSLDVSNNALLNDLYCKNNPYLLDIWLKAGQTIEYFEYDSKVSTIKYRSVPEAVDLGLSVKWASFNLGASAPEEYGDYYAWGGNRAIL